MSPSTGTPATASGERPRRSSKTPSTWMSRRAMASLITCSARPVAPTSTMFGVNHPCARQRRTSDHQTVCSAGDAGRGASGSTTTCRPGRHRRCSARRRRWRRRHRPPRQSSAICARWRGSVWLRSKRYVPVARRGERTAARRGEGGDLGDRGLGQRSGPDAQQHDRRDGDDERHVRRSEGVRSQPAGLARAHGREVIRAQRPTRFPCERSAQGDRRRAAGGGHRQPHFATRGHSTTLCASHRRRAGQVVIALVQPLSAS